jgi:hypothetical protein
MQDKKRRKQEIMNMNIQAPTSRRQRKREESTANP